MGNRDPFADRMLQMQPRDIDAASVLFDDLSNSVMGSSPHVVDMTWLRDHLGRTRKRSELVERFVSLVQGMASVGARVEAALIGGSFVSSKPDPMDIDFLLFYSAMPEFDALAFRELVKTNKKGLDFGVTPTDTGVVSILKNAVYFHVLFQGKGLRKKGSILLVL